MGNIPDTRQFYLSNNRLTGIIPPSLANLPLENIALSGNNFTCIPPALKALDTINDFNFMTEPDCRPIHRLTITAGPGGAISPAAGTSLRQQNDRIPLTATPAANHRLYAWTGACATTPVTSTRCTVTMSADQTVGVTFKKIGPGPDCAGTTAVPDRSNLDLQDDCRTLIGLREELRGGVPLQWGRNRPIGDWEGITVSGTPPRVTAISLAARGFLGRVPALLGTLDALTRLDLSFNKLGGSIPAELGALSQLQDLLLYRNRLTGEIPPALGDLANLQGLSLSQNYLSGPIPAELGTLAKLRSLHLYQNQLTGPIPPALANIEQLGALFLAENPIGGCLPRALLRVANHDLDRLALQPCPLPTMTLPYDHFDPTGAADQPGRYTFLDDTRVVTTYEELRDGTVTTLRLHPSDADGTAHTDLILDLLPGDLVEWKQATDCFVRYTITDVRPPAFATGVYWQDGQELADPPPISTTIPAELTIAWMTYAFTGCSGAIPAGTGAGLGLGDLPNLGGTSLTVPIRHGAFQIIPEGWTGATETPIVLPVTIPDPLRTRDIAVARQIPHWRDPVLPDHWEFILASVHGDSSAGYVALWTGSGRGTGLRIIRNPAWVIGGTENAVERPNVPGIAVTETRVIAGRPAWVSYGVPDPGLDQWFLTEIAISDPETDSIYRLHGLNLIYLGPNIDALIAVAASLFADEESS